MAGAVFIGGTGDDFVDEGLFVDIYDFKLRNDAVLEYDVEDKLHNIKAKSLILGIDGFLHFNINSFLLFYDK